MQKSTAPSVDLWLREAKSDPSAAKIGMYLIHNGTVRETAKAMVREGAENTLPVTGMDFSYDREKLAALTEEIHKMEGIFYIRTWLNEGKLDAGDDIMYILLGGDTRPHVLDALQYYVQKIKSECVKELEIY